MEAQLQLDIVTPDRTVVHRMVDYVGVMGVEGEFGVLPQHIPMLAALQIGKLSFRVKGETFLAFVSGGFAEIAHNKVTILTEAAELADEIDVDRAQDALDRARQRLEARKIAQHEQQLDDARARSSLRRAVARLHVASS